MTKHVTFAFALSLGVAATSNAAVVIDSTFANGNGSFEFDEGGAAQTGDNQTDVGVWVPGDTTSLSTPYEITQNVARNNGTPTDGSYEGAFGAFLGQGLIQNTGFDLGGVNTKFSLSFDWKDQFGFAGADGLRVELFYSSDDTIGGTLTSVFQQDFTKTLDVSYTSESISGTLTGGAGRDLWIVFSGSNPITNHIGRLDNIQLSATIVPEPGTLALLGIGALILSVARRRRNG